MAERCRNVQPRLQEDESLPPLSKGNSSKKSSQTKPKTLFSFQYRKSKAIKYMSSLLRYRKICAEHQAQGLHSSSPKLV